MSSRARRPATALDNLIIVAGHAVYVAEDFSHPEGDASWSLENFQKGEPRFFLEHIRRGVELAAADERSLLVFSGGMTRREAGRKSEAEGYRRLAAHFDWWGHVDVAARCATEEYARDSFENLLYGVCAFRVATSRYPEHVTAVSWRFKEARFDLHREAIRLPPRRFTFVGVNDPVALDTALKNEAYTLERFRRDPYGVASSADGELADKRAARNPFAREHDYEQCCFEVRDLLRHRGRELFQGPLPWS